MPKIKLIRNTVCDGKPVSKGEVVDASAEAGRYLINIGKAVPAQGEVAPRGGPMTYNTRVEDPEPVTKQVEEETDDKPKPRRGRKPKASF